MNIINWTPHTIYIYNEENEFITAILPEGVQARIETTATKTDLSWGIPFFKVDTGKPYLVDTDNNKMELPLQKVDTIYIVSGMFRSHYSRDDLYQPGQLIRNNEGQPIGCIGLSQ